MRSFQDTFQTVPLSSSRLEILERRKILKLLQYILYLYKEMVLAQELNVCSWKIKKFSHTR